MADSCPTCVMLDALMASRGFTKGERTVAYSEPVRKVDRKVKRAGGRAVKGMKSALKEAHARAKKKNGEYRKGWDQSRMMSYAHKIRRRNS